MAKKAIILAAGQGTRMRSKIKKVLHLLMGKPVVQYVVEAAYGADIDDITIVIGADGDDVRDVLIAAHPKLNFVVQHAPMGTGHAVKMAQDHIESADDIIVLSGDMPLVTSDFIQEFMQYYTATQSDAAVAAVYRQEMGDFGRVYANEDGTFIENIEFKDLKPDSPVTNWGNTSIHLFNGGALKLGLGQLSTQNSQGEYYLTDVPKILLNEGKNVHMYKAKEDMTVFTGINTQVQLSEAVQHMRTRINTRHMLNGVRFIDPASVFIDDSVEIESDVVIYPGVILEHGCKISTGATIGAYSHLQNVIVKSGAHIRHSVLSDAVVGEDTQVGPFAYLRMGATTGKKCRIGNFVEIKNADLGNGVKMAHLAYIGDADVGDGVNYSCGAITANYDGKKKYRTKIGKNVFVGSNVNLIAPVSVGDDAFIAAGSTITDDLAANSLGIARARQVEKLDWAKK